MDKFVILTEANTARCVFNNPLNGHCQEVDTLAENHAINYAAYCFARQEGIPIAMVEMSVRYPVIRV